MKKRLQKILALGLGVTMAAGMFVGCGSSSSSSSASSAADTAATATSGDTSAAAATTASGDNSILTFGCQNYGAGLVDPANQINAAWNCMRYGIGECLFKFSDTMEVEPWLAESYEVSDDHKTWTITLRDDVKFSDGCEMTATKVKESFERLKEAGPDGSSKPENYLEYEAEIEADDEANTITIKTQTAYPDLTKNLAYPVMAIIDVADITDYDHGVIGTGPYVIDTYTEDVGYDLVANENYREEVPYEGVQLLYMGDASAKAMALKNGQVDLVENITNVSDIADLQEDENYTVDIANGVRCGFAYINQNGVLGNDTLRQAVQMAIDDETICSSNLIGGLYSAGYSVLPSNLAYNYDQLENPYAYDVDAANKLLDDAKIVDTDGDGIRELDGENIVLHYIYYDNRLLKEFAQAQAQYLAEIGISVEEDEQDSDTEWNMMVNGEYDLCASNWTTVGTGDPTEYLANWYGPYQEDAQGNYCGYQNDEYDKLYSQLLTETDNDTRTELITEMQQILIDDAAVLIDGYYKSSMIYSKNVGYAHIHTADYYWLSTEITPAE